MQTKLLKLLMAKFRQMKWNSYGLLPVLVLCLVCSCNSGKNDESERNTVNPDSVAVISGLGRIGSLDEITHITPEINGVVEKVYHEPGDTLAEGDTIFSLKHMDEMIRKRQLQAELETAETAIVLLEQQIETAGKTLETQKTYFERLQNSFEAGAESQQNVDQAKLEYEQAESRFRELTLQKGSRLQDYEIQKQRMNQQMLTLDKHFIKAPGQGLLLSLHTVANKAVQALQPYGDFKFAGPYAIRAEIDELYAGKIKLNMKAVAVPYGRSDTIAYGHITSVSPVLKEKSMFSEENQGFMDRRVREVEVRIDSTTGEVLMGSRVNLIIKTR